MNIEIKMVKYTNKQFNKFVELALKRKLYHKNGALKQYFLGLIEHAEYLLPRHIAIAYVDGVAIGVLFVRTHYALTDKVFEVSLYIKPPFRHKGVGKQLIDNLVLKAKIEKRFLYNCGSVLKTGNQFFKKMGIKIWDGGLRIGDLHITEYRLKVLLENAEGRMGILMSAFHAVR